VTWIGSHPAWALFPLFTAAALLFTVTVDGILRRRLVPRSVRQDAGPTAATTLQALATVQAVLVPSSSSTSTGSSAARRMRCRRRPPGSASSSRLDHPLAAALDDPFRGFIHIDTSPLTHFVSNRTAR
jgi:hypothetical protein